MGMRSAQGACANPTQRLTDCLSRQGNLQRKPPKHGIFPAWNRLFPLQA